MHRVESPLEIVASRSIVARHSQHRSLSWRSTTRPETPSERACRAAELLRAALGLLDQTSIHSVSDAQTSTELLEAVGDISRAADALVAKTATHLAAQSQVAGDDSTVARSLGYRSPAEALQFNAGLSGGVALAASTVPQQAAELGLERVAGSFMAGQISLAQLRAVTEPVRHDHKFLDDDSIARIDEAAERFATGDHTPASSAPPAKPEDLAKLVRNWVMSFSSADPEVIGERRRGRRYFRGHLTRDQLVQVNAQFPLDNGGSELLAVLQGVKSSARSDRAAGDTRTPEQRASDVVGSMIRAAARFDDSVPKLRGNPPALTVSVKASTLEQYAEADLNTPPAMRPNRGTAVTTDSGESVPTNVAARLTCDGSVRALIVDDDERPLRLGRTQRLFSSAQRHALVEQHDGCAAPGCTMPPGWCEAHHVRPWAAGGATDIENGILLCSFHHHEVHRARLVIKRTPEGNWQVCPAATTAARETVPDG